MNLNNTIASDNAAIKNFILQLAEQKQTDANVDSLQHASSCKSGQQGSESKSCKNLGPEMVHPTSQGNYVLKMGKQKQSIVEVVASPRSNSQRICTPRISNAGVSKSKEGLNGGNNFIPQPTTRSQHLNKVGNSLTNEMTYHMEGAVPLCQVQPSQAYAGSLSSYAVRGPLRQPSSFSLGSSPTTILRSKNSEIQISHNINDDCIRNWNRIILEKHSKKEASKIL
ncbi:hypothetical protein VNO78_25061 [Psophocarpus tetragonolobus]|uniref:Uncharacterized protein n=1 Tax=Psophocarpus tetragonolobus TaxID=3891 RepID=A0AAN9S5R7_PSOTE